MSPHFRASFAHRMVAKTLGLPQPILGRLAGTADPVTVDGRTLHPTLAAMIALSGRLGVDRTIADVATRRAELSRLANIGMPTCTDVRVVNRLAKLNSVTRPVRIYRPFGITNTVPGIVYYHGGGWVTGDLDSHDGVCRILAVEAQAVVVAVDYRLAPEDPFPAAVDDAIAGFQWTVEHSDELGIAPDRIGVMGDSAGGTLAAVVAQQLPRDRIGDPAPIAQGLIYPATDAHMATESITLFADGFFLTKTDMEWFRERYLGEDSTVFDDVRASPLLADDVSGLPPALVVTAGFDPLRDEGDAYARRLRDAGVPVNHRCYADMVHGFFGMGVIPGGLETIREICAAMGTLIRSGQSNIAVSNR